MQGASVIRVWDCLLMEGVVVLFRVALALLKAIEGPSSSLLSLQVLEGPCALS